MLQTKHINVNHRLGSRLGSKLGFLVLLGLFTSIGLGTINSRPTHALTCDENSMVSCIDITFGDIVGSTDLQAPSSTSTSHGIDRAYFYLPVSLTVVKANDYNIKVYSQNGGELRSKDGDIIPTLSGEAGKGTSLTDLGKNGSVWGYRYNLSDSASDQTRNYLKVPSISDPEANIVPKEKITAENGTIAKVLTLGFATAVDGNLPAGEYSDKIVVAITATPKQTNAFGLISTMQEMTPEICASATTPRVDAALPDSTGIHHGDDRYVPETTLIDTRDNKSYLIRKLADGNCWMGQNLELDILAPSQNYSTAETFVNNTYTGEKVGSGFKLTSADTDLNSKEEWSIATDNRIYATQAVANGDSYLWEEFSLDGARSYNYSAEHPEQAYTIYLVNNFGKDIVSTYTDSPTGQPYQRKGNLYNWGAVTANSMISQTGEAPDSICPRGWKLPSATNYRNDLSSTYGIQLTGYDNTDSHNRLSEFPLQFFRTGRYQNGRATTSRYTNLYTGTSTRAGGGNYFETYIDKESGYTAITGGTHGEWGMPIRCIAR